MLNQGKSNKTMVKLFFVFVACLMVSSCYQQHYFPVEIGELTVSPAYRLEIQNDTTRALSFLPRDGADESIEEKKVSIGDSFTTLLQIKRIIVGGTTTREVVSGPYVDSGRLGPDAAYIKYNNSRRPRDFVIALESDSWFEEYKSIAMHPKPLPKTLKVHLTDQNLSKPKWFRQGPANP